MKKVLQTLSILAGGFAYRLTNGRHSTAAFLELAECIRRRRCRVMQAALDAEHLERFGWMSANRNLDPETVKHLRQVMQLRKLARTTRTVK